MLYNSNDSPDQAMDSIADQLQYSDLQPIDTEQYRQLQHEFKELAENE